MKEVVEAPYPSDSAPRSRRKNATPGGSSSLISPPSPPTKAKEKKLSWFERTLLCMQIAVHKENYEAYVDRKHITHNQGILLKEVQALSSKGKAPKTTADGDSSGESDPSDATIPYHEWQCDSVDWAAFGDVTSQPSSSVRIGERSGAAEDEDEDPAYSRDDDDEDNEDSTSSE